MVEEVVGGEEGLERGEGVRETKYLDDTKYLDLDTFWKYLERRRRRRRKSMEHGECRLAMYTAA